jgi:hypothetical protein
MMFFVDLMFALVLAMGLSLFLPGTFGWRRPGQEVLWGNMVFLFLLIFLISWAGGVWLPQSGPVWRGGYWLPFLLTAFFVVMLLFAMAPLDPPRTREQAIERATLEMAAKRSLGVFFWLLVIGSGIAIIIHYFGQVPWLRAAFYGTANRG